MRQIDQDGPLSRTPAEDPWEILDHLPELLLIQDAAGRIVRANRALGALFGIREVQVLEAPLTTLLDLERVDADEVSRLLRQALDGERQTVEWWGVRGDGERFPIEVSLSPGTYRGAPATFALVRDISERARLAEQLRLAQRMEAVGRLAGGLAHDFNNLLTVIRGHTSLLLLDLPESGPMREEASEIERAAERAASMTRQLLAFSRQQLLQPRVVDVNAVVLQIDKMLRRLIGEDIEMVTLLDPEVGRVRADPSQLDQVLMNLVVNARDAMPDGGKLAIRTHNAEITEEQARQYPYAVEPGPYVVLAVEDTGCGMDRETLARIFEPFFTTKEQGKGTGLGLSTVYGIVKQSGGYIWVDSEPGRGTTFTVYLPRAHEAADRPDTAESTPWSASAGETVLVVEDEEAVRGLVRLVLRRGGYRPLEAANGEEALRLVREHPEPIAMILTDLVMPLMGGRELVQRLSDQGLRPRVLYMSGYADAVSIRQETALLDGAFIQKPFSPDALLAKVREVLDDPAGAVSGADPG